MFHSLCLLFGRSNLLNPCVLDTVMPSANVSLSFSESCLSLDPFSFLFYYHQMSSAPFFFTNTVLQCMGSISKMLLMLTLRSCHKLCVGKQAKVVNVQRHNEHKLSLATLQEFNENENTTHQNLWDKKKAVFSFFKFSFVFFFGFN